MATQHQRAGHLECSNEPGAGPCQIPSPTSLIPGHLGVTTPTPCRPPGHRLTATALLRSPSEEGSVTTDRR